MQNEILVYRILNENPLFYDIYKKISSNKVYKVFVFELGVNFDPYKIPSEEEFREIDRVATKRDQYGTIWNYDLINKFGNRLSFTGNLIHVYSRVIPDNAYLFKNKEWDWAYFCYDDAWVEIFVKTERIAEILLNTYEVKIINYPGSIKSWLSFVET